MTEKLRSQRVKYYIDKKVSTLNWTNSKYIIDQIVWKHFARAAQDDFQRK